jgi:hypothetical protein
MRLILTLLAAVAFGTASLASTPAFAQDASKKTTASQKKPGKTCGDIASNTQAHKDCIAKQAHSAKTTKTTKAAKLKANKTPKKSS